jgi:hypothetical protein
MKAMMSISKEISAHFYLGLFHLPDLDNGFDCGLFHLPDVDTGFDGRLFRLPYLTH